MRLPMLLLIWSKQWGMLLNFTRFDDWDSVAVLRMCGENVNSCVKWLSKRLFILFI